MTLESSDWCVPSSASDTPVGDKYYFQDFTSLDRLRLAGLTKTVNKADS